MQGLAIVFEDAEAPEIHRFAGALAVAAAAEGGGRWAVLPGLEQPERGLARGGQGPDAVVVALFPGEGARISFEAAVALGLLATEVAEVEIVALRSQARLAEARPDF